MNKDYIFIFTVVFFFLFFRKIVNLVISSRPSNTALRVKTKVFHSSFGAIIAVSIIILYVFIADSKVFNPFVALGLLLASAIRLFTMEVKYLKSISLTNDLLTIEYLTPFLKPRTENFNRREIVDVELTKPVWLMDYPDTINVRHRDGAERFLIADKGLIAEVQKLKETHLLSPKNISSLES